jgi:hypothetical protein
VSEGSTVAETKLCIPRLLKVKGKGIKGVADKEAYIVQMTNIISQWQYVLVHCLSSYVGNVFGLHNTCIAFPSTRMLVM